MASWWLTSIAAFRLEKQLLMSVTMRPFSWLRFIDDIDMKWLHGRDNLDTFLQEANSFHSTIQFTAEVSNDKHVFLDTQSRLDENRISTDLYTKPMDTHQYLLPTSCHPKHCCKNIPYSLALRLRRICSDSNTFELRAKELTNQLHRRGYLKQDIASAIDKARQRSRDALLSYRPKSAQYSHLCWHIILTYPRSGILLTKIGPSSSHQMSWRIFTRANQSWLLDAPKAFVISWYEHDSNQTLMMTTKLVNVDPVAEKDVNAAKW